MYNKFILYDGRLLMGRVRFHRDLIPDDGDKLLVRGGGMFKLGDDDSFIFYGESVDFGKFNKEELKKAGLPERYKTYKMVIL